MDILGKTLIDTGGVSFYLVGLVSNDQSYQIENPNHSMLLVFTEELSYSPRGMETLCPLEEQKYNICISIGTGGTKQL